MRTIAGPGGGFANRRGHACRAIQGVAAADLPEGRNSRRGGDRCCVVGSLMRHQRRLQLFFVPAVIQHAQHIRAAHQSGARIPAAQDLG